MNRATLLRILANCLNMHKKYIKFSNFIIELNNFIDIVLRLSKEDFEMFYESKLNYYDVLEGIRICSYPKDYHVEDDLNPKYKGMDVSTIIDNNIKKDDIIMNSVPTIFLEEGNDKEEIMKSARLKAIDTMNIALKNQMIRVEDIKTK